MRAALHDLHRAIDEVDGGLDGLDDDALAQAVEHIAAAQARLQAVWLRAVGAAAGRGVHRAHGFRDAAGWVAEVAGDRRGGARRDVELAERLAEMPAVAEALAAGVVSRPKAAELARANDLPSDLQAELVADAAGASVEQVAAAVQRARLEHGLTDPPFAPAMSITPSKDRARVEATLGLVDAEVVEVAAKTAAEALKLPAELTTAERNALGLVAACRYYLDHQNEVPSGRVGRPHVLVLVDLLVLLARTGGSAVLGSGAVISGDDARRLAADANISRVITSGRSEVLDVGRATRSVPPAIAKAVIARDRHCRYRSCHAPPWACDIHHRQPWAEGGATSLENLGLLCWHHHEHVHRHGAQLDGLADGRWAVAVEARTLAA